MPHTLISQIHEYSEALSDRHISNHRPLLERQISARRVVTASVQKNHIARLGSFQIINHAREINTVRSGVVIAVRGELQAHRSHKRNVNGPRGIADPNSGIGRCRGQHLGCNSQRTATAGRLDRRDMRPVTRKVITKD